MAGGSSTTIKKPPEDGRTLINGQLAVNLSVQINQSAGKTRRFVCGQTARDIRDLYKQEYLKYLWSLSVQRNIISKGIKTKNLRRQ